MIEKSLIGYGLAFVVGLGVFLILSRTLERWFEKNDAGSFIPFGLLGTVGVVFFVLQYKVFKTFDSALVFWIGVGCSIGLEIIGTTLALRMSRALYWVTAQWASTGYLFAVWLVQDFANIFVFLPRELTAVQGFLAMVVIVLLLGITFANRGGPVQKILETKQNVTDIRSATIIDFIYASLLYYFADLSDIPMSTTWVFLGLIAGREYGFALTRQAVRFLDTFRETLTDVSKALFGLVVSLDLAVSLPFIARLATGEDLAPGDVFSSASYAWFVGIANALLLPLALFVFRKNLATMVTLFLCYAGAAATFFYYVGVISA
jgi:hypothetical protein